jgi:hypothetical protein
MAILKKKMAGKPAMFKKSKLRKAQDGYEVSPKKVGRYNPKTEEVEDTELDEVIVKDKSPAKKQKVMPKATVDPSVSKVKAPVSPTKAKEPKKMGRVKTALSDATSAYRGAANMAFGKNQSKTKGGKVLERAARLASVATGVGVAGGADVPRLAKQLATGTRKAGSFIVKAGKEATKAGLKNLGKYAGVATALGPAAVGQMDFKNRSEESKKRGLLNPGKGKANIDIDFDKPFKKKTAAADSTAAKKKMGGKMKKYQAGGVVGKQPKAKMVDPKGAYTKVQKRTLAQKKKK